MTINPKKGKWKKIYTMYTYEPKVNHFNHQRRILDKFISKINISPNFR